MKVLALDSTASVASVALTDGDKILASYNLSSGNTHSTTLLPMIESVLSVLKLDYKDIDLFALSAGPGSFTGVRIGAATLQGAAFAGGTPCVGVSSLEAMAWNLKELEGFVIPAINARRNTVFTSVFWVKGGVVSRVTDDDTMDVPDVCEHIKTLEGNVYVVGDGAELIHSELAKEESEFEISDVPASLREQNAVGVAFLAAYVFENADDEKKKEFTAENLLPIYLKKAQAEREREERLAKENNNEN